YPCACGRSRACCRSSVRQRYSVRPWILPWLNWLSSRSSLRILGPQSCWRVPCVVKRSMNNVENLAKAGYALLSAQEMSSALHVDVAQLSSLAQSWSSLPRDEYLRDGGHYRSRRHACFIQEGINLELTPHRAHWQPTSYNALHGGLERWFEPIAPQV